MSVPERRSVLVTGSSTGIGRACALELSRAGFTVFAGVRKVTDGEALAGAGGERIEPLILDVTDAAAIAAAAEAIGARTGGRLDGLVNNAGIVFPGPIEGLGTDSLREQLEVNVIGQVAVTRAMLGMVRPARGRIVFMSSIGGRIGLPFSSAYTASKHAIEAIGDALRQEVARFGVGVSIIEPGSVATPIWEKGEARAPALIAAMAPEVRELYREDIDRLMRLSKRTAERGVPPERVAEAVLHALTSNRPRTRYLVGTDAKIQARLRPLLPDRVFDRLIAREFSD